VAHLNEYHNTLAQIIKMIPKLLVVITVLLMSACTGINGKKEQVVEDRDAVQDVRVASYAKESPSQLMTDDGKYRVSLYSNVSPIPLQKIHSWTVHIEYANGQPVENVKVYIHGGMPTHRHKFPTKPRVKKYLGSGNYLIEGVKFSMHGDWEIRINILEKTLRDRAVFPINLAP